jgi:type II secretory pathway pseudopilin PulG
MAALMLLAALAIIGVVSAHALQTGATLGRRDAEAQLLAIGAEYRQALWSYAGLTASAPGLSDSAGSVAGSPSGLPRGAAPLQLAGPMQMDDLLADPRTPGLRRHLRRIYVDPLTGRAEWGTVRNAQGAIVGIYSLAPGTPIRTSFEAGDAGFDNARSYRDWVFGLPATP